MDKRLEKSHPSVIMIPQQNPTRYSAFGYNAQSKDMGVGSILWEDKPQKFETGVLLPTPSGDQVDSEQIQELQRKPG